MRWFFLFLCLFQSVYGLESWHYVFTPFPEVKTLQVELTFQAQDVFSTEVALPMTCTGESVKELHSLACDSKGTVLVWEASPESILIHHAPQAEIHLRYFLRTSDESSHSNFCLNESFLRMTGDEILVIPHEDSKKERSIIFEWKDLPAHWKVANSFGIYQTLQELTVVPDKLHLSLFVGGEFSLVHCGFAEGSPCLIICDSTHEAHLPRLLDLFKTIHESQCAFWKDRASLSSNFLMVLLASQGSEIYAQAKHNAFIAFFPPLVNPSEKEWENLAWVLTHEHFHVWNPFKMLTTFPKELDQLGWFVEGFSEYYTAYLCLNTQTLSREACLENIQRLMQGYDDSPYKNMDNVTYAKERWKGSQNLQLLAYQRGCRFALFWDDKIRLYTRNQYSLDDLVRAVLQKTTEPNTPLSLELIASCAAPFLREEAAWDIQHYIVEGHTIPLSPFFWLHRERK